MQGPPMGKSGSTPSRGFSCRFCGAGLRHSFVDLGMSPLCQTHIAPGQLHEMEPFYPLHAYVCGECFLVQLRLLFPPQYLSGPSGCSPS